MRPASWTCPTRRPSSGSTRPHASRSWWLTSRFSVRDSGWTYAAWAGSAAAVAAAGLLFLRTASTPAPSSPAVGLQARDASPALSEPAPRDLPDERAWSVVEDLGGEIDGDAATAALTPATGAADLAVEDLDSDEQAELVRRVAARAEAENGMMRVGAAILLR